MSISINQSVYNGIRHQGFDRYSNKCHFLLSLWDPVSSDLGGADGTMNQGWAFFRWHWDWSSWRTMYGTIPKKFCNSAWNSVWTLELESLVVLGERYFPEKILRTPPPQKKVGRFVGNDLCFDVACNHFLLLRDVREGKSRRCFIWCFITLKGS